MAKKKFNATEYIDSADQLAKEHDTYVETYVSRAHSELYKLLAGIMKLCIDIQAHDSSKEIAEALRKKLRTAFSVKVQKNSNPVTIVVKYVVRTNRKTAHVYGRVINAAIEDGISPSDLPAYISKNGGIEKIRKSSVKVTNERQDIGNWKTATAKLRDERNANILRPLDAFKNWPKPPSLGIRRAGTRFKYIICDEGIDGLMAIGVAYPTVDQEEQILRDYVLGVGIAAQEGTADFWRICAKVGMDQDTVNTWRKANGFVDPVDVANYLTSFGVTLKPEILTAINEADQKRKSDIALKSDAEAEALLQ